LAQADRNRALDAEKVAKEQTDRALKAEQVVRDELETVTQVRHIIPATVYLKNIVGGEVVSSGTGFVIEEHADTAMVVTNRHVAVPNLSDIWSRFLPPGSKVEIEAVFRSGQGPQNEQALPAQILAVDTSDDFTTDLAFLVVKGVKRPPTPINVVDRLDPTEGMAYLGAGFPLGGRKVPGGSSDGNPSVNIMGGRIAALRRDDHGQLKLLQIDGSIVPGASGGAILEEKTGKLIGVALANVGRINTIGFVIPADEVRRALAGRVGALDLTLQSIQQGAANLQIKADLVDPKGMVKAVIVHVAPAAAGAIVPYSDGSWPPLPNTEGVQLQHDPNTASASGRVQVALSGQGVASRKVLIQTAHRYRSGQIVYSKPNEYDLPDKPGRIGPRRTALPWILEAARRKSESLLGRLIDPDKDCGSSIMSDKRTIGIPGNKLHTLASDVVTRLDKKKSLHNAPMFLIEVEGDFAALVKITGEISPGSTLPKDRQDNNILSTFQGAGLLLYQDKDNYVRLERTAGVAVETLQPIHKVLFEVVKDGKPVDQSYPPVPEGPLYLLLMRRKGRVVCGASHDLGALPVPIKGTELDLPSKVRIGLSASNISAKPFTATFENFAVLNDVSVIDEEFGNSTK